MGFIIDDLFKQAEITNGGPILGYALLAKPGNQSTVVNPTTNIGGCTGIYYSMVFQLLKWNYTLKKLDESLDVSPVHAEAYNLTIEQKYKLEQTIKSGLASSAQAVADYELMKHDLRRYRDIIDLMKKAKGLAKDKSGKKIPKEDNVLRQLFIDRVDAHTGEGFSMVSMARRWPTIISDFIKMGHLTTEENSKQEKIREKLSVTIAEANILKTKNDLFETWKETFIPEVKERYARIKTMVQARDKSVEQYKEWLKPYVARYKMMKDTLEKNPSGYVSNFFMSPAFGNATLSSSVRMLAWAPFVPPEVGKPQRIKEIDPYDGFAKYYQKKIEDQYKVKISQEDIDKLKKDLVDNIFYYRVFNIEVRKSLVKIPKGGEVEDMDFDIVHRIASQNVILVFMMEILAMEKSFENEVKEIIGTADIERGIRESVEKEFEEPNEEEKSSWKNFSEEAKKAWGRFTFLFAPFYKYFFRYGPYESVFVERVTKQYMIPMGGEFAKLVNFLKWKAGVPGAPEGY